MHRWIDYYLSGIANAATEASKVYLENKDAILEKMKTF
jgi:hypothetical protein